MENQDTKNDLKNNIKNWLVLENEIKVLQKELKERRNKKKEFTQEIVNVMKQNEIDCFDIKDGKLMYTKNKIKSSLSKKHLLTSLNLYFKNDKNTITELSNLILNSRKETIKENIKHKIKK
tara:strand:- start:162 stop:524 length:363 start_codon:yes stop_codon:yes gene_type:complete